MSGQLSGETTQRLATYLQGLAVGLAGGYFAGWWLADELMYGIAGLAIVAAFLGYVLEARSLDTVTVQEAER